MRSALLSLLLFASPVLAEPVCEKWQKTEAHCEKWPPEEDTWKLVTIKKCITWVDEVSECIKWHETPTPVATPENPFGKCMQWRYGSTGLSECDAWSPAAAVDPRIRNDLGPPVAVDVAGRIIVSKKSDAEALKALGLKMCEGR